MAVVAQRDASPLLIAVPRQETATRAAALRDVLLPFLASRALFALMTLTASWWVAAGRLPRVAPATQDGVFAEYWYRWDALWYMRVATDGYRSAAYANHHLNLAFFPLYPLLLHVWFYVWPWSRVIAAMLIANLCYAGASYYLYRLVALDHGRAWAVRVVWLLAFFPTSLFLFAGYSEGLFLLCLVLCFYQLRLHHWWRAACWGALATATRPLGIIVIVPFLIYWYQVYGGALPVLSSLHRSLGSPNRVPLRLSRHPVRRRLSALYAAAVIPLGLLAFMAYLWARFGTPFAATQSQRSWHRTWALPWQTLYAGLTRPLANLPHPTPAELHGAFDTLWALAFLALTVLAARHLPRHYVGFLWLFWAFVLSTPALLDNVPDPLISLPRFLLTAFPLLIFLAGTPRRALIAGAISVPLLVLNTAIFVSGGWVA